MFYLISCSDLSDILSFRDVQGQKRDMILRLILWGCMSLQKWLIIIGCLFIVAGLFLPLILKSGFGRLPGDIYIKKDHVTFYFPIVTCIIISVVISLIIWLLKR